MLCEVIQVLKAIDLVDEVRRHCLKFLCAVNEGLSDVFDYSVKTPSIFDIESVSLLEVGLGSIVVQAGRVVDWLHTLDGLILAQVLAVQLWQLQI